MKQILILAYYFPPLGMGGTQRGTKFVKYLPSFDWAPLVVTVKNIVYYAKDPSLLQEVQAAKVYRTGSLDPQRLLAIFSSRKVQNENHKKHSMSRLWRTLNKIAAWFLIPDSKVLWLPFALLKSFHILWHENIDCIFTTSPPHSTHLAGLVLKKFAGIPCVVDFRDGWSAGNFQKEPTRVHQWLNWILERWVLKKADAVIGVSLGLVEKLKMRCPEDPFKFYTITNGFDTDDLMKIKRRVRREKFTMTYCGTLSAISPVSSFLNSLGQLLKLQPQLQDTILVEFVGRILDSKVEKEIHRLKLESVVKLTDYVNHAQALEKIVQADLLLYPVATWASSDFIPGKTFEYLASGNRVLAIGPGIEGMDILQRATSVERVSHEDMKAMQQIILKNYSLFQKNSLQKAPGCDISKYERKFLTRELAKVLDSLILK